MTNTTARDYIESKLQWAYEVGICHDIINTFSKRTWNRLIENANDWDHTDVPVTCKGEKYIVEIMTVDDEKDFMVKTLSEYNAIYK
jgi:hypothetical protein